jgi:large subunit ribosomal protein L25
MDKIVLQAQTRKAVRKANNQLRAEGITPAVVYGHGQESTPIQLDTKILTRAYAQAGGNKIIGLKVDDARQKNVLIHDTEHDSRTGLIMHADFYIVRMDEKIRTEIPLHFIGESTAVYQDNGSLLKNLETIEIEALPGELPESIDVDIAILDDFDKAIHVSDLIIPAGVELISDPEELVVKVEAPRSDEELAELEAEVTEVLPEGTAEDQVVINEESGGNNDKEPKPDRK